MAAVLLFQTLAKYCRKIFFTLAAAFFGVIIPLSLAAQEEQCTVDSRQAPLDFTLQDMNGEELTLSDYSGNVILLDFWATWCAPCRIEIPGFIELVDEYGSRGFSVLGVSINDPVEELQIYAQELGMNYPVLVGDGRDDIMDAYGPLTGFPTSLIIDRDGRICHRHVGFTAKERFESDIRALL